MYSDGLNKRYHNLLISYDFARVQRELELGVAGDVKVDTKDARQLLEIERSARENRQVEEFGKAVAQQKMAAKLNEDIEASFREKMADVDHVLETIIGINDSVPAILDILSVRAASIARVEPLISALPWLEEDLIKFVNLPQYRKADATKNIRVDKIKTALSYIGLENMQFVVPSFAMRKWIPYSTEPFRLMKRKLWEASLGAAICCRRLAQIHNLDEGSAFAAGMFHDIGKSAIVRLYLRTFDEVWKKQLSEARDLRLKEEHDALVDMEPEPTLLRNLMLEYSANLSAYVVETFALKRMIVLPAMEEFAQGCPLSDMSPMGQVLVKGISFSRYKLLQRHNLLAKHEAKILFKENQISTDEIIELRQLSLRRLHLRMEQQ